MGPSPQQSLPPSPFLPRKDTQISAVGGSLPGPAGGLLTFARAWARLFAPQS